MAGADLLKRAYGFHPLLVFLDRTEISAGEALAGKLRPGNAGSNTTADRIAVLGEALAGLPAPYRPRPADPADPVVPGGPQVLIRSDSAGTTCGFAQHCRSVGVGFFFGFAVTATVW